MCSRIVSLVRQASNYSQVWTDGAIDQSLVVEIVEHQARSDQGCAEVYFQDLADRNEAAHSQIQNTQFPSGIGGGALKAIVTGCQSIAKGRQLQDTANTVQVQLAIFRYSEHDTDILVSMNTPTFINAESAAAEHDASGQKNDHLKAPELFMRMLKTFQVSDYSLFG